LGIKTLKEIFNKHTKTDTYMEIRDIHANNMADSGIGKIAIASYRIFKPFHLHRRFPIIFSTTWIFVEVPILLPKCLSYLFHNLYCILIQNQHIYIIIMLQLCWNLKLNFFSYYCKKVENDRQKQNLFKFYLSIRDKKIENQFYSSLIFIW